MKNAIIIFIVFAVVGFGGGYLFNQSKAPAQQATPSTESKATTPDAAAPKEEPAVETAAAVPEEGKIFSEKGCIQCHSIENLGIKAGAVGPDLSHAYANVPGKHGKPLNEFLKKPTSAVMSGVIGGKPLTDDEIAKVVAALKLADEKK